MTKEMFHHAARDGRVDLLSQASRRNCNHRDEDGLTPTLLAARYGRLGALRRLIGRGGNPDKCDLYGRSALHLAATGGHTECVTFLVSFGANIWHLDNDLLTTLDVGALHNRADIVRYLDREMGRQAGLNKKTVKRQKERALHEAHKRIDQYDKMLAKNCRHSGKTDAFQTQQRFAAGSSDYRSTCSLSTRSTSSNARMTSFFTGGSSMRTLASGLGKAARKLVWKRHESYIGSGGTQCDDDCSVIFSNDSCGVCHNDYGGLSQTVNSLDVQPLDSNISNSVGATSARLFQRPGFGNLAFFQHAGTLVPFSSRENSPAHSRDTSPHRHVHMATDSIGTIGSLATRITQLTCSDIDQASVGYSSLRAFLINNGVVEALPFLRRENIDMEALVLLSDADLKEIGLPMGPRRKLLTTIAKRVNSSSDSATVH